MPFIRKLSLLLAISIIFAVSTCAEELTLSTYLDGYTPKFITVVAYETVNPSGERMNFDAIPLDDNPGDVSDPNSNLAIAQRLFNSLQYIEVEEDKQCNNNLWHFAIVYEVQHASSDEGCRRIRLDFYDYTNVVHLAIYDPGIGTPIHEDYIQISLEDSYAFEDIYLNTVAMLRRPSGERQLERSK